MARIPFSIDYRPQIESGEYKVETKVGCHVRIVCWDMACELPILGLVLLNDEKAEEMAVGFTNEGTNLLGEPLYDKLFIVTPEEELSEFEKVVKDRLWRTLEYSETFRKDENKWVRELAAELLALAREQFIKDGYVIEKKIFHDAVGKVSPEIMEEVSKNVDMQIALRTEYEKGRADALKDLPRWKKCADADRMDLYTIKPWIVRFDNGVITDSGIIHHGHYLCFADLEKLPKED